MNQLSTLLPKWSARFSAPVTLVLGMLFAATTAMGQISVTATTACIDNPGGTPAALNQYYVRVTGLTGGTSPYFVSIDGVSQTYNTGDPALVFGPYTHSGAGNAVQVISVVDSDPLLPLFTTAEVVEVLCGYTTNNGLNASGVSCVPATAPSANGYYGMILAQSAPGSFASGGTSGQTQAYILVLNDFIVQTNFTGLFTNLAPGDYQVYAINYRTSEAATINGFLLPGEAVQPIVDGANGTGPLVGVCYTLCGPAFYTVGPCYSVGSHVFADLDDNAIFNPGTENGLPGIPVQLFAQGADPTTATPVASTITNASGIYFFGGLPAVSYFIYIPTPNAAYPSSSTNGPNINSQTTDNDDNGLQTTSGGAVTSIVFTLGPGMPTTEPGPGGTQDDLDDARGNMTLDFGFAPAPMITHFKMLSGITQTGHNAYTVTYTVEVRNNGAAGTYHLYDTPNFENNITITGGGYTSNFAGGPSGSFTAPYNGTQNQLANNVSIALGAIHIYTVSFNVTIDMLGANTFPTFDTYTRCGGGVGGPPVAGQGLFNLSQLDRGADGSIEETRTACGDLPYITHEKLGPAISTLQPDGSYNVTYTIRVYNAGGVAGNYDLSDTPYFDDDITINTASYSTMSVVPGVVGGALSLNSGVLNALANDQPIAAGANHTYTLIYNVTLDLSPTSTDGGNNTYTSCGTVSTAPGPLTPGSTVTTRMGLYNTSALDTNNDANPDEVDERCGDLPFLSLAKTFVSAVPTAAAGAYTVTYTITVMNTGGATTTYDLRDVPGFDDDIAITSASYAGAGAGAPAGGALAGSGPWLLADDASIAAGVTHTYTLMVNVLLDLSAGSSGNNSYTACGTTQGSTSPIPGEGLYNRANLDMNNDGTTDLTDDACGDLPYITHEKTGPVITATGNHTYNVVYTVTVRNTGGASGIYTLTDTPNFENDITINGTPTFTTNAPGNAGGNLSATNATANTLAMSQAIAAGAVHTYTLNYNVTLDLTTATPGVYDAYVACGTGTPGDPAPTEGLYNATSLDAGSNGSIDETDEVCGDLPYIVHRKDAVTVSPTPDAQGRYTVIYTVAVQNLGGASGAYDLTDTPAFDNDIVISAASYSTTNVVPAVAGGALSTINNTPNTLANDVAIGAGVTQTYTLTYLVRLDLSPTSTDGGDNLYTACGTTTRTAGPTLADASVPGQGLYNSTALYLNNSATPVEQDEICADLPFLSLAKTFVSAVPTAAAGAYTVTYTITVMNTGGATTTYDLRDVPGFDDDIAITSASYAGAGAGAPAGGALAGSGPWLLADDASIAAGVTHTYTLMVNVLLDLSAGSSGNNSYTACGTTQGSTSPIPGEGLYNRANLDMNNDGTTDLTDDACGDLPYITHEKTGPVITATGNHTYNVVYTVTVRNTGGASGIYTLTDTPNFENDITINGTPTFTTNAPGNAGGNLSATNATANTLAMSQAIAAGAVHTYTLNYNVTLDLTTATPGVYDAYVACGTGTPGDPAPTEGLYNATSLDAGSNGSIDETDEVCGDLPYIVHRKDAVTVSPTPDAQGRYTVIYTVAVQNLGGASGAYDLTDTPAFDNDIVISAASYSTTNVVPAVAGGALSTINNTPNTLANDVAIGAGVTQTYTLTYLVRLDLSPTSTDGGDNLYTACGTTTRTAGPTLADASVPGQGLYNSTALYLNNSATPVEQDEICADLPYITHDKMGPVIARQPDGTYNVTYTIAVTNTGGATGTYRLTDTPAFDDDFVINTATFSSTTPPNLSGNLSTTNNVENTLAIAGTSIDPAITHTYTLSYNVSLVLLSNAPAGDSQYTACGDNGGSSSQPFEGLYNASALHLNGDNIPEQTDFVCGDIPLVSVGSTVFADNDNDGLFEPQDLENGIPGVVLELFSTGPDGMKDAAPGGDDYIVDRTTTGSTGDYIFDNLPQGEYYIKVQNSQFASGGVLNGFVSSTPTDINDNNEDNDDNGIAMGNVGAADYMVMSPEFMLIPDLEPTAATGETGPGGTQDDADDNNGDMTQDFGFYPTLSLGSTVWVDNMPGLNATDNDGIQNNGETGLAGVTVQLFSVGADGVKGTSDDVQINVGPDGLLGTADDAAGGMLTNAMGNYYFGNLAPGRYYVVLPSSNFASGGAAVAYQLSSTPTDTNDNNEDSDDNGIQMVAPGGVIMSPVIELAAGTEPVGEPGVGGAQDNADDDNGDMTVDFGLIPMMSVGSTVFADNVAGVNSTDNDGIQNNGEPGIAGVAMELWNVGPDGVKGTGDDVKIEAGPDGILGTADDGTGDEVTNANGDYFFSGIPEGIYYVKIQTSQFAAGGSLAATPLSSTVVAANADGNVDSDNNGVQMGGQGGMVMSNPFTLTAGDEPTVEPGQGGTQDNAHPYTDANGNMTIDFGFVPAVSVGSTVFLDENNNGLQDLNEQGIAGVEMTLYDVGPDKIRGNGDDRGVIATTVTNSNGDYFFGGLYEGNYIVIVGANQFAAGMSLVNSPLSSVPTVIDGMNITDADDNGIQTGGQSTETVSPVVMLVAGQMPTGAQEDGQGGTQDDAHPNADANGNMTLDFGFIPIRFDLALFKVLAPGQATNVRPGDTVYYQITVVNQGNLAADNIVITDYVPANMSFEFGVAPQNANWLPASNVAGPGMITRTLSVANGALPVGGLAIGATYTVDVALTITSPLLPPGTVLTNLAEISSATDQFGVTQTDIDSDPDNNPNNDNYLTDNEINGNGNIGGDEDDHDPAAVTITGFDLALMKILAPGQSATVRPGDTIHYRIRVINQGAIPADNIVITDYVPAQMTFQPGITGNMSAGWAISGGLLQRTLNVSDELAAGGLLPGDSIEVSLYLTLNNPLPAGLQIDNFAEITSATDENNDPQDDIDSTPDSNPNNDNLTSDNDVSGNGNNGEDEDDHDIASITTERFDLALIKVLAAGQSAQVQPGDTIHYRIRVINQGDIPADNILITDYIPANMTYEPGISGNMSAGWAISAGLLQRILNVGDELPTGGLAPGQQVEVSLYLTLNSPLPAGITLRNFAEISAATDENGDAQVDDDSTPDTTPGNDVVNNDNDVSGNGNAGEDEDDHDYADITTLAYDLALIKLLANNQPLAVQPGDT
ncbi:MAG TPA: SdrD B-like domain-containing protein, partial [Saprospiraceae bacterium]|nr:SdrD B-like domain-containing protein [Saprospiraceae bacterium]